MSACISTCLSRHVIGKKCEISHIGRLSARTWQRLLLLCSRKQQHECATSNLRKSECVPVEKAESDSVAVKFGASPRFWLFSASTPNAIAFWMGISPEPMNIPQGGSQTTYKSGNKKLPMTSSINSYLLVLFSLFLGRSAPDSAFEQIFPRIQCTKM